jgi:hypothetical protein
LTPGSELPDTSIPIGPFRDAVRFSALQQIPLIVLSALILDGGLIFNRVIVASVATCLLTAVIATRRWRKPTDIDLLVVKWAFFPLLLVACAFWTIGISILRLT